MSDNLHPYVNIENCTRLAEYLESLSEDYQDFSMATFIYPREYDAFINYTKNNGGVHNCGTAACAVGHGPAAGILFPDDAKYWLSRTPVIFPHGPDGPMEYLEDDQRWPDWFEYSYLFIGACGDAPMMADELWDWCFGPGWSRHDNTPHGAAKRIRYMLDRLDQEEPIPLGLTKGRCLELYQ